METKIFRTGTELKDCSLAGSMLTGDMLAFFFSFDSSISQEWLEGCAELSDVQSKANGQVCVCVERGSWLILLGWELWPAWGGGWLSEGPSLY